MRNALPLRLLNVASALLIVVLYAVWAYKVIYQPLLAGDWLAVMIFVAATGFFATLVLVARRKAETTDYTRH